MRTSPGSSQNSTNACSVRLIDWQRDSRALRDIREAVFIREQNVPAELEWDEFDVQCLHFLAFNPEGNPVGTARLLLNGTAGTLGRMAVLKEWRVRGVGSALVHGLLGEAKKRGISELALHAQTHAADFYERFGFRIEGKQFMEAGIPHVKMILHLQASVC
ncbi:MAG TPA: GNAT family N-acetyltransferase [Nitrosospira sp.]|nr:GNAT family N-acetyltransferase [Nitrosospira sp.]